MYIHSALSSNGTIYLLDDVLRLVEKKTDPSCIQMVKVIASGCGLVVSPAPL